MIYGATGTLEITAVSEQLFGGHGNRNILVFGVVFLVSGLAFKLGVVPFHMWIPDVYHGAPTAVTLFIGSAPKLAAFAIVMRLLVSGLLVASPDWQAMLLILSVLSMAVGNFAAIAQDKPQAHVGLLGDLAYGLHAACMVTGIVGADAGNALNAYSSSMFYIITYVLTSAGTFGMIMLLARSGFESDEISDFAGLNKRSPWFAAMMMMMMFSLAGIPFFVGFSPNSRFCSPSLLPVISGWLLRRYFSRWLARTIICAWSRSCISILRPVRSPSKRRWDVKVLMSANGLAIALLGVFPHT